MKHSIEYVEHTDELDRVHWIELEIDDQVFYLDKGDVWNLLCISQSVFDRMVDPNKAALPEIIRKIVME